MKLVAQYRSQAVRARAGPLCYLNLVYSTQPLPSFLRQLGRHLPRRVWVGALLASVAPVLFGLGPAALRQFFNSFNDLIGNLVFDLTLLFRQILLLFQLLGASVCCESVGM